jgi:hypothetical protein
MASPTTTTTTTSPGISETLQVPEGLIGAPPMWLESGTFTTLRIFREPGRPKFTKKKIPPLNGVK